MPSIVLQNRLCSPVWDRNCDKPGDECCDRRMHQGLWTQRRHLFSLGQRIWSPCWVFFKINFDLSTVCFTMLCYFLLYSKMNLPYIHTHIISSLLNFLPIQVATVHYKGVLCAIQYVFISYAFYVSYQEITHWKRPWCCEILKTKGEEGSRWLDEFEQTLGDSEGQGSLAWHSPWGQKESDMT